MKKTETNNKRSINSNTILLLITVGLFFLLFAFIMLQAVFAKLRERKQ